MPIHMRMRKLRGPHMKKSMPFEQFGRTQTQPVNLRDLEARFDDGAEVDARRARERGLATRKDVPVKILGRGRALQEADVCAHAFSKPPARRSRAPAAPASDARVERTLAARLRGRDDSQLVPRSPRSARSSPSRRRCCCSTGSAPTSRRRASTPTPSSEISENFGGVERPRLPEPLLGRQPAAVRDLRARDHAVHHGLDHPAAAARSWCRRSRSSARRARSASRRSRSTRAT